jgi:hypothetical protein
MDSAGIELTVLQYHRQPVRMNKHSFVLGLALPVLSEWPQIVPTMAIVKQHASAIPIGTAFGIV